MFAARYFSARYWAERYWPAHGATAPTNIRRIAVEETFSWQRPVLSVLGTPPGSPVKGDRYIVGGGATGDWSGHDDAIVWRYDAEWKFDVPHDGWTAFNRDDGGVYVFTSGAWAPSAGLTFPLRTADPSAPADDTCWIVRTGTSPTMAVELKVRISGATYTLASITL
jgi:hypothetical protein